MNCEQQYPASARFFHWLMALLVISMIFLGLSMVQSLAVWQVVALSLHQSFGVLVLLLVVLRLLNRLRFKAPELPSSLPKTQQLAAKLTQVGLYLAMFAMPLTGWLMQNAGGELVSVFGWFYLPTLIESNVVYYGLFRVLHGVTAWVLLALVFMHVGAALYHRLIRQDSVLASMLGRRR